MSIIIGIWLLMLWMSYLTLKNYEECLKKDKYDTNKKRGTRKNKEK